MAPVLLSSTPVRNGETALHKRTLERPARTRAREVSCTPTRAVCVWRCGVSPATPPAGRQVHSPWACRPFVSVKYSVRPDATPRGRRTSLRRMATGFGGQPSPRAWRQLTLPTRGSIARRDLAARPRLLAGQRERERERERYVSAADTSTYGAIRPRSDPRYACSIRLHAKTLPHHERPDFPLSTTCPETGSCRSAKPENPNQTYLIIVPQTPPGDIEARPV